MASKKDEETIKTSIVLPKDLHWGMKRKAAKLEISDTAAFREAVREWVEREGAQQTRPQLAAKGKHH